MYQAFAELYDELMNDVDYESWADYYTRLLSVYGIHGGKICECACGTGSLTLPLFRRAAFLSLLSGQYRLLMVGAGDSTRIASQMGYFPIEILGNYGMQYASVRDGKLTVLREETVFCDREKITRTVEELRHRFGFTVYRGESALFFSSGCATFPVLGTNATLEEKLAFDPDKSRRRALLPEVRAAFPDYEVFVGGTSSFDLAPRPYNKYYALVRFCCENGIPFSDVLYVGDDPGEGGNDEPVYRAGVPFVQIDDYRKLPEKLAFLLPAPAGATT